MQLRKMPSLLLSIKPATIFLILLCFARITTCLGIVPPAAAMITAGPALPIKRQAASTAASDDNISKLWSDALSLISNAYGSSSITNVAALTWPSTVVVEGSTYVVQGGSTKSVPVTSTHTTITTSSSITQPSSTSSALGQQHTSLTASSSATSTADPASVGSSHSHTLVIVLGVVCGIFAVLAIVGFSWFCYRAMKRRKAIADDESAYESWKSSTAGSQMAEDTSYRYKTRSIPPVPMDAHRYSQYQPEELVETRKPLNPFLSAEEHQLEQGPEPTLPTQVQPAHPESGFRGNSRENWWQVPRQHIHRKPLAVETTPRPPPSNSQWAPPPRSPKRPQSHPNAFNKPPQEASNFDFGFQNRLSRPMLQPIVTNRRSAPNMSGGLGLPANSQYQQGHSPRRSPHSSHTSASYHTGRYSPIQEDEAA